MKRWSAISSAALLFAACAPSTTPTKPLDTSVTEATLRAASCADEPQGYDPSPIVLTHKAVRLGSEKEVNTALPEPVKFLGGWHLTSTDPEFGGLSGLAILEAGALLAVSDKGYSVVIRLSENIPNGAAGMVPLLDLDGQVLTGKADGDAEGLAYRDGLAYISFERNHRILAYNFRGCSGLARGVPFAGLAKDQIGVRIAANDGAEALDFGPDGRVRAGYETIIDGRAPIVTFDTDGIARDAAEFIHVEDGFKLVGADAGYHLFRAYDREQGNRNIVTGPNGSFRLAPPLSVDNFEGIAVMPRPYDTTLIYLISDDNFSGRQRTLLYLFEVADPA